MKFRISLPLKRLVSNLSGHEEWGESLKQKESGEPIFQGVDILYNFVFDLGDSLNPIEAARKILEEDFSLAAAINSTGDIEMASHFKPMLKLRQQAQQISEFSLLLQKNKRKETINWLIRHPRWGLKVLSAFIENIKRRKGSLSEIDPVNLYQRIQKNIGVCQVFCVSRFHD